MNLGHWSLYRSNTSFKKKQTSTRDFCPSASSVCLTCVVVPSLVKVTWNFVPSVEVYLVNVLIVYSHKVALQIKGKTSLVDQWGMREVGDLKKKRYSHPEILCREDARKNFSFRSQSSRLIGVSMMFAMLWSRRVSTDSASANTFELFGAATLLSSSLWHVVQFSELRERWWGCLTGSFISVCVFRPWRKLISFFCFPLLLLQSLFPCFLCRLKSGWNLSLWKDGSCSKWS